MLGLVPLAVSTFGEIVALGLQVHVWCQRCKQQRPVRLNSPALYARTATSAALELSGTARSTMTLAIQPFDRGHSDAGIYANVNGRAGSLSVPPAPG